MRLLCSTLSTIVFLLFFFSFGHCTSCPSNVVFWSLYQLSFECRLLVDTVTSPTFSCYKIMTYYFVFRVCWFTISVLLVHEVEYYRKLRTFLKKPTNLILYRVSHDRCGSLAYSYIQSQSRSLWQFILQLYIESVTIFVVVYLTAIYRISHDRCGSLPYSYIQSQ